jgi:hypothetical protein
MPKVIKACEARAADALTFRQSLPRLPADGLKKDGHYIVAAFPYLGNTGVNSRQSAFCLGLDDYVHHSPLVAKFLYGVIDKEPVLFLRDNVNVSQSCQKKAAQQGLLK